MLADAGMTVKQAIIEELGEEQILATERIARSLVANDQVKYYFALLQTARDYAETPSVPVVDLKAERIASRLGDAWLDDVVAGTRKVRDGVYHVPHGPELLRRIEVALSTMLECLPEPQRAKLRARADRLTFPEPQRGLIPGTLIIATTSGDRKAGDSLHLVVMDAHKAINRLQAETALETVAGAKVHRLSPTGRRRVEAFMQGVNRTAPLKFDHPGLGTTATEDDGRVLIQNDIGTTDAHVLVVRVKGLTATLTYTDVHRPRLTFFKSLFESFDVKWETTEDRRSEKLASTQYMLATGRFDARNEEELDRYLAYLGSRIVFLIDWNRMRKRLRGFVGKEEATLVLKWAADCDYGHRALLEIGGEGALAEAVEYAAGGQLRYGQRLDELISRQQAVAFLKDAFRLAATGLMQRRSRRTVKDEIKARLKSSFEHERLGIFTLAAEHAAIGYDLAFALVEALTRMRHVESSAAMAKLSARATLWESRADQLLNEARDDIKRFVRPRALTEFMERCDDAIDEMEEAAALLELAHLAGPSPEAIAKLGELAELVLMSAQEIVKSIECAASITRSDIRDDLDEFMTALEWLIDIEHKADYVMRSFRRWLVENNPEPRLIMVLRELSQALETATDAHLHAGQALRAYLMEELIA